MKAQLKDGSIVDLGNDYITLVGEPGDHGDFIWVVNSRLIAVGCNFEMFAHNQVHMPIANVIRLDEGSGNTLKELK